MSTLDIKDLHVSVETEDGPKEILRGVTLTVDSGETHAIMGPNGSGKSTLAYSIAGHPKYTITGGTVTLDGEDLLGMSVDERARAGLFLAMQYPVEVPGVSEKEAQRLVVHGFFNDLIRKVGIPSVEEQLLQTVEAELAKNVLKGLA